VWRAAAYNTVFLVLVALVFILFAESLVGVFTSDPVVLAYGADCLRIVSYGYGLYAVGMVVTQAFNGAGDTDTPTLINFVCFWLLQIPLAFALAETLAFGTRGVYAAVTIAESILAVVAVIVFRRGRWKLKAV
jgi:Na+-driven multidrug efflux pump